MEASVFKKLLIDLYQVYNPDKIAGVDNVVAQYNGREFDAIKTVFLKYNFKQSPYYDPNIGTDKHVKSLIDKYSSGDMKLTDEKKEEPVVEVAEKKIEPVKNVVPFEINLKFNFDSTDIIIPDLSNFLYVSITQRIIFRLKNEGIIGVEVVDILDDYVSNPEMPSREIILEKR